MLGLATCKLFFFFFWCGDNLQWLPHTTCEISQVSRRYKTLNMPFSALLFTSSCLNHFFVAAIWSPSFPLHVSYTHPGILYPCGPLPLLSVLLFFIPCLLRYLNHTQWPTASQILGLLPDVFRILQPNNNQRKIISLLSTLVSHFDGCLYMELVLKYFL